MYGDMIFALYLFPLESYSSYLDLVHDTDNMVRVLLQMLIQFAR